MTPIEMVALAILACAGGGLVLYWRSARLRQLARDRLDAGTGPHPAASRPQDQPFPQRFRWVALLAGALLFVGLTLFTPLSPIFTTTFGVVVIMLGLRLEAQWADRRRLLMESQLANALDLMISTLQAGASVTAALETATLEARPPLRNQLDDVLGRIRFGDEPLAVLRDLQRHVPLETFRLFGSAMAVHWEVGGSLAPVLAAVGRAVRDRIELARRIHAMTTQARLTIGAVLATTYFVGLAVWRNDPARMESFLRTRTGQYLVAGMVVLQALGIAWASVLTRMKRS
jgi:tight adherence protein B